MALADYKKDVEGCNRCSICKWVPLGQIQSWRFSYACPSIARHNFHAYSGSGRMIVGLSMLEERSKLSDMGVDIIYRCLLCGACDSGCKVNRDDIDVLEVLEELRSFCVEEGRSIPEHAALINALEKEGNVFGEPQAERGAWAEGLGLKDINTDKCDVIYHAGCRFSYDKELWDTAKAGVNLMRRAGADIGIAGGDEACCGGRAFELGYRGEMTNLADAIKSQVRASGARTLVTGCADCYSAFKYLFPRMGKELPVEVLHITEYLSRAIAEGGLHLDKEVPLRVTYHDPCHLGRKSEPYLGEWKESKLKRPARLRRSGRRGIYDQPREVLRSIPGLALTEMERIREWSWCCGAGGGVLEAYPDFASWTAAERIEEALSTGAEALVTACPWCERMFRDAIAEDGVDLKIYDLTQLVLQAAGA